MQYSKKSAEYQFTDLIKDSIVILIITHLNGIDGNMPAPKMPFLPRLIKFQISIRLWIFLA